MEVHRKSVRYVAKQQGTSFFRMGALDLNVCSHDLTIQCDVVAIFAGKSFTGPQWLHSRVDSDDIQGLFVLCSITRSQGVESTQGQHHQSEESLGMPQFSDSPPQSIEFAFENVYGCIVLAYAPTI